MPLVTLLTRDDWDAGPLRHGHVVPHEQFIGLSIHHTVAVMHDYDRDGFTHGDLDDVVRYMQHLQVARPDLGNEVPYSFVTFEGADPDDRIIAEGRGFGVTGADTKEFNSSRYGVAQAGNTSNRPITVGALQAMRWVGRSLAEPWQARATFGHRDVKATVCPGDSLYPAVRLLQPPFGLDEEEDDDDMAMPPIIDSAEKPQRILLPDGRTPQQSPQAVKAWLLAGSKMVKLPEEDYDAVVP